MPAFTFTIAPVQEAPVVYEVLSNIDLLFSDAYTAGSLHTLAMLGMVLGLLVACIRGVVTQKLDIHIVFLTIVIYMALMVPRVTVEVREGATGGPFIGNVQLPLGIAASASLFSSISDGLTRLYTDYVTTPAGWTISPNESWKMVDNLRRVVAPKVMDSKLNTTVPYFADNVREYIKRCVVEDLANTTASDAGKRVKAILEGPDIWNAIESRWGWRMATWIDDAGVETRKTCPDYYSALTALWTNNASWSDFQKEAARLIVGDEDVSAQLRLTTAHREVVDDIISTGETALEWMQKLYLQNQLVAMAGEGPGGIDTVKMIADAKYDTLIRSSADATLWSEVVWKYATLIWVLVIALLPFLSFLLFLGSSGLKLFFTFVAALAWVSLWNPIAAVLQSILGIAYTAAIEGLLHSSSTIELQSMKAKMVYYNELAEWISTGNYLMMSVPVIALFMLTGSSIAANSLIGKMNEDGQIDTKNVVPRDGSMSHGTVSKTVNGQGMVATSEVGQQSLFNNTLKFGKQVSAGLNESVENATEAAHAHEQNYTRRHGRVAGITEQAARENAYLEAEQRDNGTSSTDQDQQAFKTSDGQTVQSGTRARAGMALMLNADNSIKRIANTLMAQRAWNNYKQMDAQKLQSLDKLSDRELNVLQTASAYENAQVNDWENDFQEKNNRAPTAAERQQHINNLRDVGAVKGKGEEARAERERRSMLRRHGNLQMHQVAAGDGNSIAGGRVAGGMKGVRGHLMMAATAGYAIMPDIGISGKAEAASADEASNILNSGKELSATNLMSYSEEETQRVTDRWQETMKSEYGLESKDVEEITNAASQTQSARDTLSQRLAAQREFSRSVASEASMPRPTFMNNAQDLTTEGLRKIPGMSELIDSEAGQDLIKNGGAANFAYAVLEMAPMAGNTGMARSILEQAGFDQNQIRAALGPESIDELASQIGDGQLSVREFSTGNLDPESPQEMVEKVSGGSEAVQKELDKADQKGWVPQNGYTEEGVTVAAAGAAKAGMDEYIQVMRAQANAPVERRNEKRSQEHQQRLAEYKAEDFGEEWLKNVNDQRAERGAAPILTNPMQVMDEAKGFGGRMVDRFMAPDKAVEDANRGAKTLEYLEGAQSMLENMDTSNMTPDQRAEFKAYQTEVNEALSAARASGALGGTELPEDGSNIDSGSVQAVSSRIDAISDMGDSYGERAASIFGGLVAMANLEGQGDITGEAYQQTGNYSFAGEVLSDNLGRFRVNDAVSLDDAEAAVLDGASDFVGADREHLRSAGGFVRDATDAVGEFLSTPDVQTPTDVYLNKTWGNSEENK